MVEIRRATTEDVTFIALLARITFAETFEHLFSNRQDMLDYFDATFSVQKIASSITKPNNIYWIAFVDKLPVGYAKLKLNSYSEFVQSNHSSQLQKIYVLKDYLSMKIGLQLQNELLNKAKEEQKENIWLSVFPNNKRALNFYLRNGFVKAGEHNFQIGAEIFDFYAMVKSLA
jgi:ribosomal protein S18 acetylase RimI-like enzyme